MSTANHKLFAPQKSNTTAPVHHQKVPPEQVYQSATLDVIFVPPYHTINTKQWTKYKAGAKITPYGGFWLNDWSHSQCVFDTILFLNVVKVSMNI